MKIFCTLLFLFFISLNFSFCQWEEINDGLYSYNINTILLLDDRVLVGGEEGLFVQEKKNSVWRIVNYGLQSYNILRLVNIDNKIYAGTDAGLFYSKTKGETWLPLNNGINDVNVLSIAAKDDILYIGCISKGLLKSTDKGQTWTAINGNLKDKNVSDILLKDGKIFVATYFAGLSVSSDEGGTWTPINSGLTQKSIRALRLAQNNTFLIATNEGVFKSTDEGSNWLPINNGLWGTDVRNISIYGDTIFAATTDGVYRTYDFGENWKVISRYWFSNNLRDVKADGAMVYAGFWDYNSPGSNLFFSTNYGDFWEATNLEVYNLIPKSITLCGNILIAGTYRGTILVSTNGGDHWISTTYRNNGEDINQLINVRDTIYATTQKTGVLMSVDSGFTWHSIKFGLKKEEIYDIICMDNILYVSAPSGVFAKNTKEDKWILQDTIKYHLYKKDSNIIWAQPGCRHFDGDEKMFFMLNHFDSSFFVSMDKGNNWIDIDKYDSLKDKSVESFAAFKDMIIAGTWQDGIYYSKDLGEHWEKFANGMDVQLVTGFLKYKDNLFVSSGTDGVFGLNDKGDYWISMSEGMDDKWINQHTLKYGNNGYLYVGINGGGFYRAKIDDFIFTDVTSNEIKQKFSVFPNPFYENTIIKYYLDKTSNVTISIYDIFGNNIKQLLNDSQDSGEHTAIWDGTEWNNRKVTAGTYFYRVNINDKTIVQPVTLLK